MEYKRVPLLMKYRCVHVHIYLMKCIKRSEKSTLFHSPTLTQHAKQQALPRWPRTMALAMPVSQLPAGLPPEDPHLSHCSESQLRLQPVVCLPGLGQFNMWPLPWLSSSVGSPRAVCAVASDGRRQRAGVHGIPQPPHTSWDLSTSETQSFGGRVCPRFSGMVLGSH